MTKLLQEAMAHIQTLPEDDQNRAAEVLLIAFAKTEPRYSFSAEQLAGIDHAIEQAKNRAGGDAGPSVDEDNRTSSISANRLRSLVFGK